MASPNGDPEVSVICTAKDASRTISETIASVQEQTFENWELIVVDDGSVDDTPDCVMEASESDSRIRLLRTAGVGRSRALNLAVSASRAGTVANVDADDRFHRSHLEILERCRRNNPEYAVYCTKIVTFGLDEEPRWPPAGEEGSPSKVRITDVTPLLVSRNPVCHSSVLISKESLARVGGYDESVTSQIDYDLWIRIAAAGGRIGQVDLPLVAKRIHVGQSFEGRDRLRYLLNSARTQSRAIRLLGGGLPDRLTLAVRLAWGMRPRRIFRGFKKRFVFGSTRR